MKHRIINRSFSIGLALNLLLSPGSGIAGTSELLNSQTLAPVTSLPKQQSSTAVPNSLPSGSLFSEAQLNPLSSAVSTPQHQVSINQSGNTPENSGPIANAPEVQGSNGAVVAKNGTVAFASSSILVPEDNNQKTDIYARDQNGKMIWVTRNANGDSFDPKITADGRYIIFTTTATNLIPGDTNGKADVVRYDLGTGTFNLVSRTWNPNTRQWTQAKNGDSSGPNISPDGFYAAYLSYADNLPNVKTQERGAFVFDFRLSITKRVNLTCSGESTGVAVNEGGTYAVSDCIAGSSRSIILHDLRTGQEKVIDIPVSAISGFHHSGMPQIANGVIVFESNKRLTSDDQDSLLDIYSYEISTGKMERLSGTTAPNGRSHSMDPAISSDGRFVVFESTNVFSESDINQIQDIYLYDRQLKKLRLVTFDNPKNLKSTGLYSGAPSVEFDGKKIRVSYHSNVLSGITASNIVQVYAVELDPNPPALMPPVSFRAGSTGSQEITLNWNSSAPGTLYEISYFAPGSNELTILGLVSGTSYTAASLLSQRNYTFRIRAIYQGTFSNFSTITVKTAPVPSPTLSAGAQTSNRILLSWNAIPASENITGYEIVRSLNGGNDTVIAKLPAGTTSFTDSGLPSNATCYYLIRAVRNIEFSLYSNTAIAKTKPLPPAPALTATALTASEILLNWKPLLNEGITGYEIIRSVNGGNDERIATLGPDAASFTDKGLPPGATCYYIIRAIKGKEVSLSSNTAIAKTKTVPLTTPALTAVALNSNEVLLNWNLIPNEGITNYRITRTIVIKGASLTASYLFGPTVKSFKDGNLGPGIIVIYTIQALKGNTASPASLPVTVVLPA